MIGVYSYAAILNITCCKTQWTHTSRGVPMDEMFQWVGGAEFGPPATSQTTRFKHCAGWTAYCECAPEQRHLFVETRKRIREYYFDDTKHHNESLNLFGEGNGRTENVAWHIRRGDVGPSSGVRYLSNVEINQALTGLYSANSVQAVHFLVKATRTISKQSLILL